MVHQSNDTNGTMVIGWKVEFSLVDEELTGRDVPFLTGVRLWDKGKKHITRVCEISLTPRTLPSELAMPTDRLGLRKIGWYRTIGDNEKSGMVRWLTRDRIMRVIRQSAGTTDFCRPPFPF